MGACSSRVTPHALAPDMEKGCSLARPAAKEAGLSAQYDRELASKFGGPLPVHFPVAFAEWPSKYGSAGAVGSTVARTALVTGGASGIGLYISQLLARLGFDVILPARPGFEEEVAAAAKAITEAVPGARLLVPTVGLDLGSFQSVREFAAAVRVECPRLDVLCCNAGRGGSSKCAREETADGMEAIMQVNILSHALLCCELLPLLKAAPSARIVMHTSGARLSPGGVIKRKLEDLNGTNAARFDAFGQYQLSKVGMCLFTRALNTRLQGAGVENVLACVADPGLGATAINMQHNLGHSLLGLPDGCLSAKKMHSKLGQHAADGALPAALACVDEHARRNDWYTPRNGLSGEAVKGDARKHVQAKWDPMNEKSVFQADYADAFWSRMVEFTGAAWVF